MARRAHALLLSTAQTSALTRLAVIADAGLERPLNCTRDPTSSVCATAPSSRTWVVPLFNRSTQHLLILLDWEVSDGLADCVHHVPPPAISSDLYRFLAITVLDVKDIPQVGASA